MVWFFGSKKGDKFNHDKVELPELPETQGSVLQLENPEIREEALPEVEITPIPDVKSDYIRTIAAPTIAAPAAPIANFQKIKPISNPSTRNIRPDPIFIRLDKFETTIESIAEIKAKIVEIEQLIGREKRLQDQAEKELDEWEREIEVVKSRMDSIDQNLFEKLG